MAKSPRSRSLRDLGSDARRCFALFWRAPDARRCRAQGAPDVLAVGFFSSFFFSKLFAIGSVPFSGLQSTDIFWQGLKPYSPILVGLTKKLCQFEVSFLLVDVHKRAPYMDPIAESRWHND